MASSLTKTGLPENHPTTTTNKLLTRQLNQLKSSYNNEPLNVSNTNNSSSSSMNIKLKSLKPNGNHEKNNGNLVNHSYRSQSEMAEKNSTLKNNSNSAKVT